MLRKLAITLLESIRTSPSYWNWTRGRDVGKDIMLTCPETDIRVIFDIGAHLGKVSKKFSQQWPASTVYAFEPTSATFKKLQQNAGPRIVPVNAAVHFENGQGQLVTVETGSSNHLAENGAAQAGEKTETVKLISLDSFCEENNIARIDLMKIDTEGHEFDVLKGATHLLSQKRIGFIKIESGVDHQNPRHINYKDLVSFLEPYGFRIFGIYDQENEFFRKEPQLRRFDVVFIQEDEIRKNAGKAKRNPKTLLDVFLKAKHGK